MTGISGSHSMAFIHAEDGFVGYAKEIDGIVVGQGDTLQDAYRDLISAIKFHLATFAPDSVEPT